MGGSETRSRTLLTQSRKSKGIQDFVAVHQSRSTQRVCSFIMHACPVISFRSTIYHKWRHHNTTVQIHSSSFSLQKTRTRNGQFFFTQFLLDDGKHSESTYSNIKKLADTFRWKRNGKRRRWNETTVCFIVRVHHDIRYH